MKRFPTLLATTSAALSAAVAQPVASPQTGLIDVLFAAHPSAPDGGVNSPEPGAPLLRPFFFDTLKDPSLTRASDGSWFLTGTTTGKHANGLHVWTSRDRADWRHLGMVHGATQRFTAPEIHFFNNTFHFAVTDATGGLRILRSASGSVQGPYTDSGVLIPGAEDPSLFVDDDGSAYAVWGRGFIAPLNATLDGLAGHPRFLQPDGSHLPPTAFPNGRDWPALDRVGKGGAFLAKIDGEYCLFASEVTGRMQAATHDVFVAVADSIFGPYSPRYLAIPHAGQTTVVQAHDGEWFATYSGHLADDYAAFREQPGAIPLERAPDGRLRPSSRVRAERSGVSHRQIVLTAATMRDPSVTTGSDGYYYMVGTGDGYGYRYPQGGIKLWRSRDLAAWEDQGYIWRWEGVEPAPETGVTALWAPEINYVSVDKTYYLAPSIWRPGGSTYLLRSTTGKPEGPYANVTKGKFTDGIDGFIFEDDDGSVYFLWGGGQIGKLKADRSGFESPPVRLTTVDGVHVGYEGNALAKIDGRYVLTGAEWNGPLRQEGTYDMMYGLSDSLFGPYTKARVGVPHAGHGTVFKDFNGAWWTTMFGNDKTAPFRMHMGLVPLRISDQGHIEAEGER